MTSKIYFPFTRIVGQEDMKRAILLNIVDPGIGGVLIKGEKGTAKSTTVRSLGAILPERMAVNGCPFRCAFGLESRYCSLCAERISKNEILEPETVSTRVVELPLNATEDRVAGTLDIEHMLKKGEKKFEPGILAEANGNILYVDEVNLLDDHIVDMLLDSAAMGVNYVEREGISFSHPARFVLIGTMNPEEGDIRPQLLDRFGLSVEVKGEKDTELRKEVVRRRVLFDENPEFYFNSCQKELSDLKKKIKKAQQARYDVVSDDSLLDAIVSVTSHFGIDGHRADITMLKAAKANAALEGRKKATKEDIAATASLVLSHRVRRRPFEETSFDTAELEKCLQEI
jgi:magnesium chelatase subunit I